MVRLDSIRWAGIVRVGPYYHIACMAVWLSERRPTSEGFWPSTKAPAPHGERLAAHCEHPEKITPPEASRRVGRGGSMKDRSGGRGCGQLPLPHHWLVPAPRQPVNRLH